MRRENKEKIGNIPYQRISVREGDLFGNGWQQELFLEKIIFENNSWWGGGLLFHHPDFSEHWLKVSPNIRRMAFQFHFMKWIWSQFSRETVLKAALFSEVEWMALKLHHEVNLGLWPLSERTTFDSGLKKSNNIYIDEQMFTFLD